MTLYEKIIEYGNAREQLAEVEAERSKAARYELPFAYKSLSDLEDDLTHKRDALLADIKSEMPK